VCHRANTNPLPRPQNLQQITNPTDHGVEVGSFHEDLCKIEKIRVLARTGDISMGSVHFWKGVDLIPTRDRLQVCIRVSTAENSESLGSLDVCPSFGILKLENKIFWKLGLFRPRVKGDETYSVRPLESGHHIQ
jgi:hypothetical protein